MRTGTNKERDNFSLAHITESKFRQMPWRLVFFSVKQMHLCIMDGPGHITLKEVHTSHTSHSPFPSPTLHPLWPEVRGVVYGIVKEQESPKVLLCRDFTSVAVLLPLLYLLLFTSMRLEY